MKGDPKLVSIRRSSPWVKRVYKRSRQQNYARWLKKRAARILDKEINDWYKTKDMKHNFSEQLDKDQKEMGTKTNDKYFSVQEGNGNVVRILTPGTPFAQYFVGKGVPPATAYGADEGDPRKENKDKGVTKSIRYVLYVIDRSDGLVKQAELPYSIMKAVGDLQKNPDYSFDELPMPYDIRITYKKDEAPANKYSIAAIPKPVPVMPTELAELEARMAQESPEQAVQRKKDRQLDLDKENGVWIAQDDRQESAEIPEKSTDTTIDINPDDIPF